MPELRAECAEAGRRRIRWSRLSGRAPGGGGWRGISKGRGEVGGLGGEEKLEEVGEKKMNDCDSGARSPDKLPGGEDETSTAPLPEKPTTWWGFALFNVA
ncbi:hypothetical protein OPV22_016045 [Ensete ventricosum]|uniref:Uncharacterized protein n=1 Tax=Ensete ventricosum TaxID=4639 RepID=A0AAV8QQP4_ENSVE|nr:hypothetical protein OPV22_016045 [Ensete ventricosum]